jgi:bifunctional DNase/RNase
MLRRIMSRCISLVSRSADTVEIRRCQECGRPAVTFVYQVERGGAETARQFCGPCGQRVIKLPNPTRRGAASSSPSADSEVTVELEQIIFSSSDQQIVVLRETDGPRRLSFFTGYHEAAVIRWAQKREAHSRPLTHESWLSTVAALGAEMHSACVHDRREDVYFADVRLLRGRDQIKIDVRPSDALIMSLRARVPFLFTERLLAEYAVSEPASVWSVAAANSDSPEKRNG